MVIDDFPRKILTRRVVSPWFISAIQLISILWNCWAALVVVHSIESEFLRRLSGSSKRNWHRFTLSCRASHSDGTDKPSLQHFRLSALLSFLRNLMVRILMIPCKQLPACGRLPTVERMCHHQNGYHECGVLRADHRSTLSKDAQKLEILENSLFWNATFVYYNSL